MDSEWSECNVYLFWNDGNTSYNKHHHSFGQTETCFCCLTVERNRGTRRKRLADALNRLTRDRIWTAIVETGTLTVGPARLTHVSFPRMLLKHICQITKEFARTSLPRILLLSILHLLNSDYADLCNGHHQGLRRLIW